MANIKFSKGTFLKSALKTEDFYPSDNPEIALIGRSNVGKSSIINHLLRSKKLAKTSRTPGKTQLINFFDIDNQLTLVDLPGYGYAKVSQKIKKEWSEAIEAYLSYRSQLKVLLVLLDINRTPNADDLAFFDWADHFNKPCLVVFTKTDKLKQKDLKIQTEKNLKMIGERPYVHFSIKEKRPRDYLIEEINKIL